ncbi:trypsin-like peptidase domain-containing protein [Entomospira entomophila]|uniref:Trypsin-like serine protease n=1 Tax=Entomospira entomophila TaxID=2719988 RepID=A0A968KTW1_9SPIO|nr:trypsin-like peptidase domain-containing protein [Entomospira entomophilus]NIZ40771.1 trypsin-like serine protease [Entomospira entomophilus]WDI34984.1 trypsin-like peptidase domain-containing protein [Entomospira entomophilus]
MKRWLVGLVLTGALVGCMGTGPKGSGGIKLPADTRILGPELLENDPVGYYELSWIEEERDARVEVAKSLQTLISKSDDVLAKLQYSMSLHALGSLDDRGLTLAYVEYAKLLISEGKVGVAFSLFGDGGIEPGYLTNDQVVLFLTTANKNRLLQTTQRLNQEATKRGLNAGLDVRWMNEPRTPNTWLNAVGTIFVDSGFVVRQGSLMPAISLGSGFFIDRSGYMVTNYHVIASAVEGNRRNLTKISVRIDSKGTKVPATLIGYSKISDMALLKVEYEPDFAFDVATYSNSVISGQRIYALGSPLGLSATITSGLISNTERNYSFLGIPVGDVMQIDVPIHPGNSGGPIINDAGVVVGIVFSGLPDYPGINFALPADLLRVMLPKMILGGAVELPYADVSVFSGEKKAELLYVSQRSQAKKAGLEQFKVVDKVADLSVKNLHQMQMQVTRRYSNTIITMTQDGKKIPVVLKLRPAVPGAYALLRDGDIALFPALFGVKLREVDRGKFFVITHVYMDMTMDNIGFAVDDSFTYLGRYRRGIPDEYFVATLKAKMAKLGAMEIQMMIVANLQGYTWA